MVNVFGGYSKKSILSDGEFSDLENMCLDDYPLIENRQKRGGDVTYIAPDGEKEWTFNGNVLDGFRSNILYQNGITTFAKNSLVVDGKRTPADLGLKGDEEYNQIVESGGYLFLYPQEKIYNKIEKSVRKIGGKISIDNWKIRVGSTTTTDGSSKGDITCNNYGTSYPSNPLDGQLFVNTSNDPLVVEKYSSNLSMWITVTETYLAIEFTIPLGAKLDEYIDIGDFVTVTITESDANGYVDNFKNGSYKVTYKNQKGSQTTVTIYVETNGFVLGGGDKNKIFWHSCKGNIEIIVPKIDYITGHNNRLWGCKYGETDDGFVNEIYASKLGDFKNWNSFAGTLADSYAASVGSEGYWTGVTTYNGYIIFFKERFMHRIYGDNPSNFQIHEIPCDGVMKGASGSLAVIDGVLYYLSKRGVMAYDGSVPQCISENFGRGIFKKLPSEIDTVNYHVSACGFKNKYIISMVHTGCSEKNYIWEYDTRLGTWCRSEETNAISLCAGQDNVYYYDCDEKSVKKLYGDEEDAITWYVQTGNLGLDSPDKKYINRLDVRMFLSVGSHAMFYIEYDSSDNWEHVATVKGTRLKTFSLPIKPKRCDHFRLRIQGEGDVKLYSITKTFEEGSDL